MKYIIFDDDSFVIFPDRTKHSSIAVNGPFYSDLKPISAGFIQFLEGTIRIETDWDIWVAPNIHCYGRSDSLKLESRKEDVEIIQRGYKL